MERVGMMSNEKQVKSALANDVCIATLQCEVKSVLHVCRKDDVQ